MRSAIVKLVGSISTVFHVLIVQVRLVGAMRSTTVGMMPVEISQPEPDLFVSRHVQAINRVIC